MSEKVFIFVHLPKVGGTTLNSVIYNNFKRGSSWMYLPYDHEKEIAGLKKDIKSGKINCITGHMAFGLHEFTEEFQYITLLREPVSRVFSYYNHLQRIPLSCKEKFIGMEKEFDIQDSVNWSVADLLEKKVSNQIDNGYTRYLAGKGGRPISLAEKQEVDINDFNQAKDNLVKYFDVIAIMEEYNKSLLLLRKYTDINDILYVKKNQAKKKDKVEVSEDLRKLVAEYNTFDAELYKFAKELMLQKFEDADLYGELSEFEKQLIDYQTSHKSSRDICIEEINRSIDNIPSNDRIALYGCGVHSQKMFELTDIRKLNIECILDTYKDNDVLGGYPVKKASESNVAEFDTIIISNFQAQDAIRKYLVDELSFKGNIISFYDKNDAAPFYQN